MGIIVGPGGRAGILLGAGVHLTGRCEARRACSAVARQLALQLLVPRGKDAELRRTNAQSRGKSRRWTCKEWASRGMRMQVGWEANHRLTRHGQASSGAKECQLAAKW